MEIAEIVAKRSHDAQTKVGGVLVNSEDDSIVATGYNGFIYGCDDSCIPNTRPEKYDYIIHSEANIIAHCSRNGIRTNGCYLVCTMTPCTSCFRLLYQSGIRRVVAKEKYTDFSVFQNRLDIEVEVGTTPEGYYELKYKARSAGGI